MIRPMRLAPAGPDAPPTLWRYIRRVSLWRQAALGLVALASSLLSLAPLDLQRRMVDDAILGGDPALLWRLAALYAAAALTIAALKFALKTGQGWLAESVVLRARRNLLALDRTRGPSGGESVSVLGSELDKLGGFVGAAPSHAVANVTVLAGVLGYMLWSKPELAWISLLLLLPNLVLAPLIQRRLNALTRTQLTTLRAFGESVTQGCGTDVTDVSTAALYGNRMLFHLWKNILKSLLGLLTTGAPLAALTVGGLLVLEGEATAGTIVAFLSGFQRIAGPMRDLIAFYREQAQAAVQYDLVRKWM
jgi:ABC-type bacteriocin/lantibiotic exporter with double-glycine peptidase domain